MVVPAGVSGALFSTRHACKRPCLIDHTRLTNPGPLPKSQAVMPNPKPALPTLLFQPLLHAEPSPTHRPMAMGMGAPTPKTPKP